MLRGIREAVGEEMTHFFDLLLAPVERRVETRVMERVEATLDVLSDPQLLEHLRKADLQPDAEARPLEDFLGGRRASAQT
jgi:hypothetical protein